MEPRRSKHFLAHIPTIALLVLFAMSPWLGVLFFILRAIDRDAEKKEQENAEYSSDFRPQDTGAGQPARDTEPVYGHDVPTAEQQNAKKWHKTLTSLCTMFGGIFLVVRGAAPQPPRPAEPAPAPAPEDQYAALQRQLRQANDAIPDPVMTAKISRLEDVSARIFALAKKDPDKKAQLQKFMDYYLPTALKLLNTYAQLSAQDVQGTNITEAKQSIERSMDLLITAFENQLDKLFASDALDVSTDIAALEGMLNLDGLTGGDFAPRS